MRAFLFRPKPPLDWSWVYFSGKDAMDFLHRLTSVDVKGLKPKQGSLGFFLNAQGKIRAFFTLWNLAPDEYAFEFNAGSGGSWKHRLLQLIDQYTFSEKISILEPSSIECSWFFLEPEDPLIDEIETGAYQFKELDYHVRLCDRGSQDFGYRWYSLWGDALEVQKALSVLLGERAPEEITLEILERWRIFNLGAAIDHEILESTSPLEIGLRHGIAENKGCYPGQEVIERILALGAPARRLVKIEGHGLLPFPGEKILSIQDPPLEIGELTSVSRENGTFMGLGLVKKLFANVGASVRLKNGSIATLTKVAPYV